MQPGGRSGRQENDRPQVIVEHHFPTGFGVPRKLREWGDTGDVGPWHPSQALDLTVEKNRSAFLATANEQKELCEAYGRPHFDGFESEGPDESLPWAVQAVQCFPQLHSVSFARDESRHFTAHVISTKSLRGERKHSAECTILVLSFPSLPSFLPFLPFFSFLPSLLFLLFLPSFPSLLFLPLAFSCLPSTPLHSAILSF